MSTDVRPFSFSPLSPALSAEAQPKGDQYARPYANATNSILSRPLRFDA